MHNKIFKKMIRTDFGAVKIKPGATQYQKKIRYKNRGVIAHFHGLYVDYTLDHPPYCCYISSNFIKQFVAFMANAKER